MAKLSNRNFQTWDNQIFVNHLLLQPDSQSVNSNQSKPELETKKCRAKLRREKSSLCASVITCRHIICLQINVLTHDAMGKMVLAEGSSLPHTSTNAPLAVGIFNRLRDCASLSTGTICTSVCTSVQCWRFNSLNTHTGMPLIALI